MHIWWQRKTRGPACSRSWTAGSETVCCFPCCCRGASNRIVDVNCGTYATFATTADGHFHAFGLNNYGQLALPGAEDCSIALPLVVGSIMVAV